MKSYTLRNSTTLESLKALATAQSKHSNYQLLHPSILSILEDFPQPKGRHEAQRELYMKDSLSLEGLHVLDIGANTGYFTFSAIADGAKTVISQEGNKDHAHFIELISEYMQLNENLQVRPNYYEFADSTDEIFDLTFCLNILHHFGDDFGAQCGSLEIAKKQILTALNRLSLHTRKMWFQLGFNWKGDRTLPLFPSGTKSELINFIAQGTKKCWNIEDISVVNPKTKNYETINRINLKRYDELGEFLNRPLFLMSSKLKF